MSSQLARPLILSFAAALALFDLDALLPGNPDLSKGAVGLLATVAIQALLVWFLLRRSQVAWLL